MDLESIFLTTLKMFGGVHRRRLRSEGRGSGGSGGGYVLFAREKGVLTAPQPKIGDGPPMALRLKPKKQRRCRWTRPGMPLKICTGVRIF